MKRTQTHKKRSSSNLHARGLHVIAFFEGAKGLLVLLVGFELLTFKKGHMATAAKPSDQKRHFEQ